jgi:hypothetical protein
MATCTGTKQDGEPCTSKAQPRTDPPRCGRHPSDSADSPAHEKRVAFLEAYAVIGNVSDAATAAGVARTMHYQWLKDAGYADAFHHAREQAADRLEREAVRRATAGVEKTIYYQGQPVGTERVYSDVLLIFLLKGMRPEKFRDNYGTQDVAIVRTPWDPAAVVAEAEPRAEALRPKLVASDGQTL